MIQFIMFYVLRILHNTFFKDERNQAVHTFAGPTAWAVANVVLFR